MPLYSWGSNRFGEAGQGVTSLYQRDSSIALWSPTRVEALDADGSMVPVSAATGEGHSLVLMESGEVFAFGKGDEGQLGIGRRSAPRFLVTQSSPERVAELEHESIAAVAAGARTSYAITVSGLVYEWGLIHLDEGIELNATNAGHMTGVPQEWATRAVRADEDARRTDARPNDTASAPSTTTSASPGSSESTPEPRTIADIVRESTELWLTSCDEFRDVGYLVDGVSFTGIHKDDVERSLKAIDSTMPSLLHASTKRYVQTTPKLMQLPDRVRASSIAAGYAHVMVLTDDGRLFSAGYNDRGQLGLGHRISTSKFHQIHALDSKVVLSVVCGHQHTLCRAIDRSQMKEYNDKIYQGELIGGDLYTWGTGVLGQLGLGLIGTSRGKLFPTLVTTLHESFPAGIVDMGAGANFSVAVTSCGQVYSWGHGEYNQHGTGSSLGADYIDHFYYFYPRKLALPTDGKSAEVRIRSVRCGDNFCIGISDVGTVYSWGWHDPGVLGHGKGLTSSAPAEITALNAASVGGKITGISCGAHHVLAIVSSGSEWSRDSAALISDASTADAAIVISPSTEGGAEELIYCHMAVLSARSPYLRGLCAAAVRDQRSKGNELIRLHLSVYDIDAATARGLLEYLYSNRLHLPSARRHKLSRLSQTLCLTDLEKLCPKFGAFSGDQEEFERTLVGMMHDSDYSDVVFVYNSGNDDSLDNDHEAGGNSDDAVACYGHSFILTRLAYFQYLLSGNFKETKRTIAGREYTEVRVEDVVMVGVGVEIFMKILAYIYSGFISSLGVNDISSLMDLFATSTQMGVPRIAQYAERELADRLAQDPRMVHDLVAFAEVCGANRLTKHCERVLTAASTTAAEP